MSTIAQILQKIATAKKGRDVRGAIHDGISQCYNDVNNPTLKTAAIEAAIQNKIDAGQMAALTIGDGTITRAKLDPEMSLGMAASVDDETLILTMQ